MNTLQKLADAATEEILHGYSTDKRYVKLVIQKYLIAAQKEIITDLEEKLTPQRRKKNEKRQ